LLGGVVIRGMAEASGAIAIAPWGRGNYDFAEPAGSEVYEAVDAVTHALAIDPQRIYLTGYSMGGFSVYNVAPLRCNRWAGIMSIAGAIVNSKTAAYLERCANVKLYIVNGANDDSIPPKYGEQSAAFLTGKGLRVSFYQEPHGTHYLRSLEPALKRAWGDMLAGSVHPVLSRSAPLEEPPTMMKPTHPY
jgi:predicted esterase